MSQKLPAGAFKWNKHKFDEDFMKNCDEDSDKGYTLEADVKYPNTIANLHGDLPFLAERNKI